MGKPYAQVLQEEVAKLKQENAKLRKELGALKKNKVKKEK